MNVVCRNMEYVRCRRRATSRRGRMAYVSPYKIRNGLGGPSFDSISLGGTKIAENLVSAAEGYASQFAQKQVGAALKKVLGEQARTEQSWEMQKTAKANQIKNVQKKKTTAEIKIDYAKKQLENYEREIELKDEMYEHLSEKYTNKDLYTWLKKETGKVYKTLFQLAAKVARKAEKCYHFEIGDTDMGNAKSFISNSYWDGAYSGLLSADRLIADLHAMEVAYLENDKNELEITREVYLDELKDEQGVNYLTKLRTIESEVENFDFQINESLFNNEFSNHYFRRIRNVQLKIILRGDELNTILDPKDIRNLSAELSLTQNKLWLSGTEHIQNRIGVQTISTSTAHLDANQFEFNFNGEKYNPFEGAGVDSSWSLSIPKINGSQIENIILTMSYTARRGGVK